MKIPTTNLPAPSDHSSQPPSCNVPIENDKLAFDAEGFVTFDKWTLVGPMCQPWEYMPVIGYACQLATLSSWSVNQHTEREGSDGRKGMFYPNTATSQGSEQVIYI